MVLSAVLLKIQVFWDVTLRLLVNGRRRLKVRIAVILLGQLDRTLATTHPATERHIPQDWHRHKMFRSHLQVYSN